VILGLTRPEDWRQATVCWNRSGLPRVVTHIRLDADPSMFSAILHHRPSAVLAADRLDDEM